MKEIIEQAKEQNMALNTIEYLLFLEHVINQIIELEELVCE